VTGKISVSGDVRIDGADLLPAGARGASAVVVGPGGDAVGAARLAPAGVLLLVDAAPEEVASVLAETLWPRPRVIGVRVDDVPAAVRAAAHGEPLRLTVTMADGEREMVLGRGGVRSL
jgi:hypothetical protein